MSHEIRTPLNPILALTSMLLEEIDQFTPQQADSLKMIARSGDLLLQVVNEVLDYAKYEAGKLEFDITRSNLQDTLESVYRPIVIKARNERNIHVRAFYDASVPAYIRTDPRRLQQILLNLLGNAVKFSKQGGLVELHVTVCNDQCDIDYCSAVCGKGTVLTPASVMREAMASGSSSSTTTSRESSSLPPESLPEEVSVPFGADVLRFVVKDYGKGIKECDFDRIFQPFQQASDSSENKYGGTGLGLPITGKLVKGLGGRIYVDSVENEWTAFTVDFPFRDPLPDNIQSVSEKLRETTVFFVFNDFFPGTVARFEYVCNLYNVDLKTFTDCDEMQAFVERDGALDVGRTYLCFYYEGQYRKEVHERLAAKVNETVLLTFGPQYAIQESQGHFPCPNSVLPTVMMDRFCSYVHSTPQGSVSTTQPASLVPYEELKILIAEDNLVNQKVLKRILNRIGVVHVDVVADGEEAVDQEAREQYDVLLMDMEMPRMNGLEAVRLIKQRYREQEKSVEEPRVAFVTAHASDAIREKTLDVGADVFLSKPYTLNGIKDCLDMLS